MIALRPHPEQRHFGPLPSEQSASYGKLLPFYKYTHLLLAKPSSQDTVVLSLANSQRTMGNYSIFINRPTFFGQTFKPGHCGPFPSEQSANHGKLLHFHEYTNWPLAPSTSQDTVVLSPANSQRTMGNYYIFMNTPTGLWPHLQARTLWSFV